MNNPFSQNAVRVTYSGKSVFTYKGKNNSITFRANFQHRSKLMHWTDALDAATKHGDVLSIQHANAEAALKEYQTELRPTVKPPKLEPRIKPSKSEAEPIIKESKQSK